MTFFTGEQKIVFSVENMFNIFNTNNLKSARKYNTLKLNDLACLGRVHLLLHNICHILLYYRYM